MNTNKRVFYVVYVRDELLQHILDAIRYLADPSEKTRAHVTIRGPYKQRLSFGERTKAMDKSDFTVTGVDSFFGPDQNTVFFTLLAPNLEKLWNKPDYPDSRPHLTIYDGDSREFAQRLSSRLRDLRPTFRFKPTSLKPLCTNKGQNSFELRAAYDETLVNRLTGRCVAADDVPDLSAEQRVRLIESLCEHLMDYGEYPQTRYSEGGATQF